MTLFPASCFLSGTDKNIIVHADKCEDIYSNVESAEKNWSDVVGSIKHLHQVYTFLWLHVFLKIVFFKRTSGRKTALYNTLNVLYTIVISPILYKKGLVL